MAQLVPVAFNFERTLANAWIRSTLSCQLTRQIFNVWAQNVLARLDTQFGLSRLSYQVRTRDRIEHITIRYFQYYFQAHSNLRGIVSVFHEYLGTKQYFQADSIYLNKNRIEYLSYNQVRTLRLSQVFKNFFVFDSCQKIHEKHYVRLLYADILFHKHLRIFL